MLKIVMILSLISLFVALACAAPAGNQAPNIFSSGDDEADEDEGKPVQVSHGQSPSMHQSGPAPNMQRAPVQQGRPNGMMKGLGGFMGGGKMGGGGNTMGLENMMGLFGNIFSAPPGGNPIAGLTSFFSGLGLPVMNLPGMNLGGMNMSPPNNNARPPMPSSNQQMPSSNDEDEE